ncbi:MAG: hypothetical protein IPL23_06940 [Saprospiraceae bacterium]|nr:hypothetical protein [Saprospiraceae bacterium]
MKASYIQFEAPKMAKFFKRWIDKNIFFKRIFEEKWELIKMKLKLWSIQESYKLQEIESEGRLICLENKFSQDWDDEYKMDGKTNERTIGQIRV